MRVLTFNPDENTISSEIFSVEGYTSLDYRGPDFYPLDPEDPQHAFEIYHDLSGAVDANHFDDSNVKFNDRMASRRSTFHRYREALSPLGICFQPNAENSSLQCCSISCVTHEQKVSVLASLEAHGVQARDYYNPPLHLQPYFAEMTELLVPSDLSATEDLCSRIISLPVCDDMRTEEVELVVEAVSQGLA